MRYNILYVDDEYNNIVVFKNAFFRYYNIYTASSGEEALELLAKNKVHLIITDQKMAGMTGVEFLEKAVELFPDAIRMIITAYSDIDFIMRAINNCGIYQYILKPWDSRELKIIIDNALESYQLKVNNQMLISDLQKAKNELETKVIARTEDLRVKNERLEMTNKIKDKLFTIISHDLRTPMASLGVLMEVMTQTQNKISIEEFKNYSAKVQTYIQHVMDLLDNLLNWSISQLGEKQIEIVPVNLYAVLQNNLKLIQVAAKAKEIEIEHNLSDPALKVRSDANMLNLILRNLLSNAVKFTRKGGQIRVLIQEEEKEIEISIADNGVGISQEKLERLLAPGYFNTNPGTAHEKGTGIGLKLCAEFIDKLEGRLEINTELDKGSTFSFILPRYFANASP